MEPNANYTPFNSRTEKPRPRSTTASSLSEFNLPKKNLSQKLNIESARVDRGQLGEAVEKLFFFVRCLLASTFPLSSSVLAYNEEFAEADNYKEIPQAS